MGPGRRTPSPPSLPGQCCDSIKPRGGLVSKEKTSQPLLLLEQPQLEFQSISWDSRRHKSPQSPVNTSCPSSQPHLRSPLSRRYPTACAHLCGVTATETRPYLLAEIHRSQGLDFSLASHLTNSRGAGLPCG